MLRPGGFLLPQAAGPGAVSIDGSEVVNALQVVYTPKSDYAEAELGLPCSVSCTSSAGFAG